MSAYIPVISLLILPLVCIVLACVAGVQYSKRREVEVREAKLVALVERLGPALELYVANDLDRDDRVGIGKALDHVMEGIRNFFARSSPPTPHLQSLQAAIAARKGRYLRITA